MLNAFSLKDKVAVVTGGAQGLGEAMAAAMGEAGARLAVGDINLAQAEATAAAFAERGWQSKAYEVDVSDRETVDAMFAAVLQDFGRLDVVVNSAGLNRRHLMKDMTAVDYATIMDVNLKGTFNVCQAAGRIMLERETPGSIINISSISSMIVNQRRPVGVYCSSKAGVNGLTRAFAAEWASAGIRVNAIAPGYFTTPLNDAWIHTEQGEEALKQTPMGRFGRPEEIGPTAVYLASDASSFMTGHVLMLDGGYTIW